MQPTIEQMEQELNRLYWLDSRRYLERLNMIKGMGYNVLRNARGRHKIETDFSHGEYDLQCYENAIKKYKADPKTYSLDDVERKLGLNKRKNKMEYKGYKASIKFDESDGIYVGEVIEIEDIIAFHCESEEEIEDVFHRAIDNYLERKKLVP